MQLNLISIKPLEDTDTLKNAFQILTSGTPYEISMKFLLTRKNPKGNLSLYLHLTVN